MKKPKIMKSALNFPDFLRFFPTSKKTTTITKTVIFLTHRKKNSKILSEMAPHLKIGAGRLVEKKVVRGRKINKKKFLKITIVLF